MVGEAFEPSHVAVQVSSRGGGRLGTSLYKAYGPYNDHHIPYVHLYVVLSCCSQHGDSTSLGPTHRNLKSKCPSLQPKGVCLHQSVS